MKPTQEQVLQWAREAGGDDWGLFRDFMPEINRLASFAYKAGRESMKVDGIHTCHDQCQRPTCVAVREAYEAGRKDAQPEQEPVAWMHEWDGANQLNRIGPEFYGDHWKHIPLYTAPPQREWQGLTDEERTYLAWESNNGPHCVAMTEAKLKEKNT